MWCSSVWLSSNTQCVRDIIHNSNLSSECYHLHVYCESYNVCTCPFDPASIPSGIKHSGSVACPASSTNTWVKWPTDSPKLYSTPAVTHVHTTTRYRTAESALSVSRQLGRRREEGGWERWRALSRVRAPCSRWPLDNRRSACVWEKRDQLLLSRGLTH